MKNFPANITIRYANPQDGPRIDVYYAGYRHGPLFAASQTVVLAEAKDTIIGVVRLCEERGYALLRTMRVDEPYQGQGIGKRLLEAFEDLVRNRDCYCLSFSYLEDFYGWIGFQRIPASDLPPHLKERLQGYRERIGEGIPLKRDADPAHPEPR